MRRLVIIGIVVALMVTMVPAVVTADDGDIQPATYSTIPFAILGRGLAFIADIVETIAEGLSRTTYGIPLILRRIGVYIATGVGDTLNNLTSETAGTAADVAEIVGNETSLNTGGVVGVLRAIACALLTPFGTANYTGGTFDPCG